jgi:hypothetical protein
MITESLRGRSSSEILLFIDNVCENRIIRYPLSEHNYRDDGAIGKKIELVHLEPGTVHGKCEADMRGLELKSKNLNAKSNNINIAFFTNLIDMFPRTYEKIKDRLGFEEYEFEPGSNQIIIKRFTIYEDLNYEKFRHYVQMSMRNKGTSFDINKNRLKDMYEHTTVIFDDTV